ncbi:nucleotidyltransferase family protein [Pararhizobium mangrovi]|uniref:MobA-like NTP transferase domain-containing protein n=1 Tax=Pararhizobium mangrovi TaxID=2590452 RepID=A0A506U997_9HYPH|nr:nucleotidyltransferase family protein [Pararhizobium mangrovi]TPW29936.1 hypothetical protein FJU11_06630 [Pararhizobium mangrovi]
MTAQPLTALVLAGSRPGGDPLAEHAGVAHKALIDIAGKPMLARVGEALAASERVGRIAVSIEDPSVVGDPRFEIVAASTSPSASVRAALDVLGTPLLVTTADHALLKREWVDHFLANLPNAGVVAALARAETIERAVPETQRTYLKFADGRFSGCNLFYLSDDRAIGVVDLWQKIEMHRKNPVKLFGMLGPGAVAAYMAGRLTLAEALERLGRKAGCPLGVVEMPFGESAIDVDKPADLELVRRLAG